MKIRKPVLGMIKAAGYGVRHLRENQSPKVREADLALKQINVGIIGTGWCGGIRANTCANNALVDELHIRGRPDDLTSHTQLQTKSQLGV